MKKLGKTGTGGEFNAKAQRRGDAKKRTDWKAAYRRARRELYKAQMELAESKKIGAKNFWDNTELRAQIVQDVEQIKDLKKRHQEAVELALKACEEARGLKEQVKLQTGMYDDLKETFLEVRTQRDELEQDLNETEAARAEEAKEMERAVAVARKLNEAVAEVLR